MKKQFRIKNKPFSISIREAASQFCADNNFIDPSIIKKTAHVDLNNKNLDNVRFRKLNRYPATGEHAKAKKTC